MTPAPTLAVDGAKENHGYASGLPVSTRVKQQLAQSTMTTPSPLGTPPLKAEPTMDELLAATSGPGQGPYLAIPSAVRDDQHQPDAAGLVSWRKGQGFRAWETTVLSNPEVKRKANVAQLYFYDYYFDLLTYLNSRKKRLAAFRATSTPAQSDPQAAEYEWRSYCGRERALLRKRRTKLRLDSFHIVCQVGQGGYGEVYLGRHKTSQEIVALKKMRKRTLHKMDEIRHVLTERDILTATGKTDWLVKLLYAFQDNTFVYLAMEFVPGGDVRTLLNNSGVLKEEHARFYAAEMCLAVDALHRLGYIHRDLKPENFLIDGTGHIKLTDFGLAAGALNPGKIDSLKHRLEEAKDEDVVFRSTIEMKDVYKTVRLNEPRYADSIVGSPDYMAIEVLRGQSYSFSVDYWSLGCILFEFLSGFPPFSGASPEETWANLKNWQRTLRRPHYDRVEDQIFNLSESGWEAIVSLIATKEKRKCGVDEVKHLKFFRGVDWEGIRLGVAPFVPSLDSEIDAGYFDDFANPEEMKKYGEVFEKAKAVEAVQERSDQFGRGVWVGFTFKGGKAAELLRGSSNDVEEDGVLECMF